MLLFSELCKHRAELWHLVHEPPTGADADAGASVRGAGAKAGANDAVPVGYDPRQREPEAAKAGSSAFWELVRGVRLLSVPA